MNNKFITPDTMRMLKTPDEIIHAPEKERPKYQALQQALANELIIVLVADTKTFIKLDAIYLGHPNLEIFDASTRFINPSRHIYQPKWRLLTDKEISDILKYFEAEATHPSKLLLPSVCMDDPMVRYYRGRPQSPTYKNGDVFEINRGGVNIFYRKVISKRMNLR